MSQFVKLLHSLFVIDYFLVFLQLFSGFHMFPCASTHVHLANLTYHKKVDVSKVKIYLLFTAAPLPPAYSIEVTTLKKFICILSDFFNLYSNMPVCYRHRKTNVSYVVFL